MEEQKFPTQEIELPSKGLVYTKDNPLSSGKVELKYPTAKEEDILTNSNLMNKGLAVHEFIKSLIVDKSIDVGTMLVGDRNKVTFAGRIMAYGADYDTEITCKKCGNSNTIKVNLNDFEDIEINKKLLANSDNEFEFELPTSKVKVTYRLLTVADDNIVNEISKKLGKKFNGNTHENTNRLRQTIIAVNGDRDKMKINDFIEDMSTKDTLALRTEARRISPNIDLGIYYECENCGYEGEAQLPLDIGFF